MYFFLTLLITYSGLAWTAQKNTEVCKTTFNAALHGVFRDASGNLVRRTSLGHDPIIVDTNILISLVNSDYAPMLAERHHLSRAARIRRILKTRHLRASQDHLYLAEKTAQEQLARNEERKMIFPKGTRIFKITTTRDSKPYQSLLAYLEEIKVGTMKPRSENDRVIVADLFFSKRSREQDIPTFVTADKGIYKPLCKLNPECHKLNSDVNRIKSEFPNGFEVTLEAGGVPRTVRILPF